jgi:hypothetical protein
MTAVTVTRPRHPLAGQTLRVLGRVRRRGTDEVLLELPDGSKSLLPVAWTDLADGDDVSGETGVTATVGTVGDLLATVALVAALLTRTSGDEEQAARLSPCEEDNRAAHPTQSAVRPGATATTPAVGDAARTAGGRRDRAAGRPDRQDRDRDRGDHR